MAKRSKMAPRGLRRSGRGTKVRAPSQPYVIKRGKKR